MISLFAGFFKEWWKRYSKCVSPLLMGAVLALCSGLDVHARVESLTFGTLNLKELNGGFHHSKNILLESDYVSFSMYPSSIDVIDNSSGMSVGVLEVDAVDDSLSFSYSSHGSSNSTSKTTNNSSTNSSTTVTSETNNSSASGTLQAPEYTITASDITYDKDVTYILHYDKQYDYLLRYWDLISGSNPGGSIQNILRMNFRSSVSVEYRIGVGMDWVDLAANSYNHVGFIQQSNYFTAYDGRAYANQLTLGLDLDFDKVMTGSSLNIYDTLLQVRILFEPVDGYNTVDVVLSNLDEYVQQDIADNTDRTADQQKEFHDQDQTDATSAGQAMSGVATDLENVKNKWDILWYPIEFTNNLMSAFQGTQAAAYNLSYGNISGYTYNESSGLLEPVYSKARSGSAGSATITFPEYTLPVLNVKLWDSYSYDMSSLKDQFPALFDALYVFVSMIEVFLFVGFLRKKYEEVFRR